MNSKSDPGHGQDTSQPPSRELSAEKKQNWTVLSMLEWATEYFGKQGVDQPRLSIEWLLADVLMIPRLNLYLQFDRPLTSAELDTLRPLVKRRAAHEPLQYISEKGAFMSRDFRVNPSVLIPRPETEELVSMILKEYPRGNGLRVLDIGTGSGCIITTLAAERPEWDCYGIDISEEALHVARENALKHQTKVTYLNMDLFDLAGGVGMEGEVGIADEDRSVGEKSGVAVAANKSGLGVAANAGDKPIFPSSFDLIVSNPPYIHPDEASAMDPQVLNYEPPIALFAEDPLRVMDALFQFSQVALSEGGKLFVELNPAFADDIHRLSLSYFSTSELRLDDGGKTRFLVSQKTSPIRP